MAHNIVITNGVGTSNVSNGNYNVSLNANGYNNSSVSPSSVNIVDGTNEYSFTVAATGTLTLHVTEDGTESGTPIVGATFKRADADGNQYGNLVTTDSNGDAVILNVPFSSTDAPNVYYIQLSSDGSHDFISTVVSTTLTSETSTVQVTNALSALRTINLTDANYEGLKISSGTLTLE